VTNKYVPSPIRRILLNKILRCKDPFLEQNYKEFQTFSDLILWELKALLYMRRVFLRSVSVLIKYFSELTLDETSLI